MGSHWVLTLLYFKNVLYWPEDDRLRSKHVAVMWHDCVHYITVPIYCCVLTGYNTLYEFVTAQRDGLCQKQKDKNVTVAGGLHFPSGVCSYYTGMRYTEGQICGRLRSYPIVRYYLAFAWTGWRKPRTFYFWSVYQLSEPRFEPVTFTIRSKHWTVSFCIRVFIAVLRSVYSLS
jgi:hypothetical protein